MVSLEEIFERAVVNHKAEIRVIKAIIEDVEFEVGQQRADVFHGFELLEFVGMDVDHESLEAAEIVAGESRLAGRELAIANFFDQRSGKLPPVSVARDDDRLPFIGDDFGFSGNFAEA